MTKNIQLSQGYSTIVDDEDYEWLMQYNWYYSKGYAVCSKYLYKMHRLLLHVDDPHILVDHVDRNKLNNTKVNLRIADASENNFNVPKQNYRSGRKMTSIYKGVSWSKKMQSWKSSIGYKNKQIFLGYFSTELDGAVAYNNKARELFGDFACINDIDDIQLYEKGRGRRIKREKTSKYIGVTKYKNRWHAQIYDKKEKKVLHMGEYKTEIEAARVYNKKAIELYGEDYPKLNIIIEENKTEV